MTRAVVHLLMCADGDFTAFAFWHGPSKSPGLCAFPLGRRYLLPLAPRP